MCVCVCACTRACVRVCVRVVCMYALVHAYRWCVFDMSERKQTVSVKSVSTFIVVCSAPSSLFRESFGGSFGECSCHTIKKSQTLVQQAGV